MSKQREHARKVLDWEALEKAPNTHGAFSFLKSAAEIVSIRRNDIPPQTSGLREGFDSSNGAVAFPAADETVRTRPYKVHRCTLVQHGQSLGETTLYQALWNKGVPETADTRIITAGWRTMKSLCGMADKSCKRNTALLIQKLALEETEKENVNTRVGRTYRVYSFASTLARRKAAGMEWATWDKGRRFVQRDGSPLVPNELVGDKTSTVVAEATVVVEPPVTMDKASTGTGDITSTVLIGTSLGIKKRIKTSSSSDLQDVIQALSEYASVADEQAAFQLIHSCREVCPDASVAEVVGLIRDRGSVMRLKRDIRNPVGFLLSSVTAVFSGEGISSYRRQQAAAAALARQRAFEEAQKERDLHEWFIVEKDRYARIMHDPKETQQRRDVARKSCMEIQALLDRFAEENEVKSQSIA